MLKLLQLISFPYFRRHWLRTLLTVSGIVLGVTVYFAIRTANYSLQLAFRETVDRVAGKAALQVTAGEAGFPESALQDVLSVPGVRAAAPVVETITRPRQLEEGSLMIVGVDMTGDKTVREYGIEGQENAVEDPLVFLAQPDSICLNKDFAARHRLKLNDTLELQTAVGIKQFKVRGLMLPKGMAQAFGGSVAVMDIYAAQFVFNRGERFDRVDVVLTDNREVDEVGKRIYEKLGAGYKVESPGRRGKRMQSLTEGFSDALTMTSFLALVVGVFLIFNTFAVAVIQRRRDIGILRALGATRLQIQGMVFLESLFMGLAGSVAGILLGRLGSVVLLGFMDRLVANTYGVSANPRQVQVQISGVVLAMIWGTLTSLVGAVFPARSAARVSPALALQKGRYQILSLGESRWRNRLGLLLVLGGVGLFLGPWQRSAVWQYTSISLSILGLSLFVPMASHGLAQMLRVPMGRFLGVEGMLASDSLIQAPRRTSATVAALLFSLSFVVSSAIFTTSLKISLVDWMEQVVNPDLVVNSSPSLGEHLYRFSPLLAETIKAVPGIRQVDSLRVAREEYQGQSIMILSIEIEQFYRRAQQITLEGDEAEIRRMLPREDSVVVSDNFAALYNVHAGDRLELKTPSGLVTFPVLGVVRDYSSDKGSLVMDRAVYIKYWKDTSVDTFDLMIQKGEDPNQVRIRLLEALRQQGQIFVLTREELWRELTRLIDQFFVLSYVQILVAIFVAIMGIVNTLFVSITDRMREIGVFRAVGGSAAQVRKMVLLEAAAIALISCFLGILGGIYLGYFINTTFSLNQYGWSIPFRFPWLLTAAMVPAMILVAFAAAWFPSVMATRTRMSEALAYE